MMVISSDQFLNVPPELHQRILTFVGRPQLTAVISKLWKEQTDEVVVSELRQIFQYADPGSPFTPDVCLPLIKEIYRQILQSIPKNTAHHFPLVSLERFVEVEKFSSILAFWSRLPGGKDHVNQQNFEALPLAEIRSQLSAWIDADPNVKNIEELKLQEANLWYLPSEIKQLTKLKELDLSENQLRVLPPEIGQLMNLTTLELNMNPLTALPPEIGQLTKLKQLRICGNLLTELPPQIGQLTKLKELDLSDHELTTLPETLADKFYIPIRLCGYTFERIRADKAYRFFNLSPEQKNTVYKCIYNLAIALGEKTELSDQEYGKRHVFASEERFELAMNEVLKTHP